MWKGGWTGAWVLVCEVYKKDILKRGARQDVIAIVGPGSDELLEEHRKVELMRALTPLAVGTPVENALCSTLYLTA